MADAAIKDLLSSSNLTFTGAVEEVGRSPFPGLEPDDRTVVVRSEQVLRSPRGMTLPAGSRVTVQLSPDLAPLEVGERATFFVNGLAYGDGLVVSEVGRASAEETLAHTASLEGVEAPVSPVEAALAELADEKLVDHAKEVDAIVRGHVTALQHVPKEGPPHEHDADWWIATLEVDVVAKGNVPGGSVSALYANSLDVRWRSWPKPKAGQSGLWLLHRASDDMAALAPYALVDQLDMQPSVQLDVIREQGIGA